MSWYQTLSKPFFSPPDWIFSPVWTVLYILMGVSLLLVWRKKNSFFAMRLFLIHLAVNLSWPAVFFGLRNIFLSLVVIILLLILIVKVIKSFNKFDKRASWLLYPYLAWVSFATILNLSIWFLNR